MEWISSDMSESGWLPTRSEKRNFDRAAEDICGMLQDGYSLREIAEEIGWRPGVLGRFIKQRGLSDGEMRFEG